jgi:hypothetical protein
MLHLGAALSTANKTSTISTENMPYCIATYLEKMADSPMLTFAVRSSSPDISKKFHVENKK